MSPRKREGGDICAIYVHAGAGFHSYQNEDIHLEACNDASMIAMAMLKNGGLALDAVEIALKLMEDREITNAGYGSNLTADGIVECDATIVDHLGRSGAVGAVSQIKNPISAARIILDNQNKRLSLHRVPPNLLIGLGATDFAYDHGMSVLPPDFLVSQQAKARWLRWKHDIDVAHQKELESLLDLEENKSQHEIENSSGSSSTTTVHPIQLLSPPSSIQPKQQGPVPVETNTPTPMAGDGSDTACKPWANNPIAPEDSKQQIGFDCDHLSEAKQSRECQPANLDIKYSSAEHDIKMPVASLEPASAGASVIVESCSHPLAPSSLSSQESSIRTEVLENQLLPQNSTVEDDRVNDSITDTIGAIAIDCYGNIAAGSSSGGIGMKHSGRVGPAALVGIGTAVIPVDPEDPERTCVAAVTSGTGEHIATTLAASTCASRIYYSQRKGADAVLEDVTEDEALKAMIDVDFMRHPGVRMSYCEAAIGVMAVKKTKDGVYMFFGHNTDSFALASMTSEDTRPLCVMSRRARHGTVAQGGRMSRHRRYKAISPNE